MFLAYQSSGFSKWELRDTQMHHLGGKAYDNQTGEIIDTKAARIDEENLQRSEKVKTG